MLRSRLKLVVGIAFTTGATAVAGCAAIAGVSDFAVDPCFDPGPGCADGQVVTDGSSTDTSSTTDGPGPDLDGGLDAADASRPVSVADSVVTLSATGVAIGKTVTATLAAKDTTAGGGAPLVGIASRITFTMKGGTSVVTFGAVVDAGNGNYTTVVTGVTEGTPLDISATVDGAALTSVAPKLEVGRVTAGLTFALDAANADRLGNFGGKDCPATGLATWSDLVKTTVSGTLTNFGDVCTGTGGWAGIGTPANPYRLMFNGVDDHVDFGAVNSLKKQTVLAWIRKTAAGTESMTSGTGGFGDPVTGLPTVVPVITKGTNEGEGDDVDINYYLGITTTTGVLASDYEYVAGATSPAAPMMGATPIVLSAWTMIGMTLDYADGKRVLYINANIDATSVPPGEPRTGAMSKLTVGASRRVNGVLSGQGAFAGDIALVLTYDRALTKAEIERNCHTFKTRFAGLTCPN